MSLDCSRVCFTKTCLKTLCCVQQDRGFLPHMANKGQHMGWQEQTLPASMCQNTFSTQLQPGELRAKQRTRNVLKSSGSWSFKHRKLIHIEQPGPDQFWVHRGPQILLDWHRTWKSRHLLGNSDYPLLPARRPNLLWTPFIFRQKNSSSSHTTPELNQSKSQVPHWHDCQTEGIFSWRYSKVQERAHARRSPVRFSQIFGLKCYTGI